MQGNWLSDNGLGNPAIGMPPGDPGTPVNTTVDIDVVAGPGASLITGTVIKKARRTAHSAGLVGHPSWR